MGEIAAILSPILLQAGWSVTVLIEVFGIWFSVSSSQCSSGVVNYAPTSGLMNSQRAGGGQSLVSPCLHLCALFNLANWIKLAICGQSSMQSLCSSRAFTSLHKRLIRWWIAQQLEAGMWEFGKCGRYCAPQCSNGWSIRNLIDLGCWKTERLPTNTSERHVIKPGMGNKTKQNETNWRPLPDKHTYLTTTCTVGASTTKDRWNGEGFVNLLLYSDIWLNFDNKLTLSESLNNSRVSAVLKR